MTADDFVFAMRRVMDPKTVSYSAFLLYPVKNAEKINAGRVRRRRLGVRRPTAHLRDPSGAPMAAPAALYPGRAMWPVPESRGRGAGRRLDASPAADIGERAL